MSEELIEFLKILADGIEKYDGRLDYTTDDDGIHVSVGSSCEDVCIGFPSVDGSKKIREILSVNMKPTHYCIKCGEMATLAECYHAKDDLYWCIKCLTDADGEHTGNAEKMMPLTPDDESDGENAKVLTSEVR